MANKLFKKPIDGNKIIAEIQARRKQPGSFGRIYNNATGEEVVVQRDTKPAAVQRNRPKNSETPPTPTPAIPEDDTEALMAADEGFRNFAQAYAYETGDVPSYSDYEEWQGNGQTSDWSPEEVEATREDYSNTVEALKDYITENDIPLDEIYNQMPEDLDEKAFELMMDPSKIETEDDAIDAGMALDYVVDILNLDTNKFFREGVIEPCGDECQAEREAALEAHRNGG